MDKKRPKIGLVLGSGGANGLAHIGVLRVLEENNIPINYIVGCSIGAIVGACYALNPDIKEEEKKVLSLTKRDLIKLIDLNFRRRGLIQGNKIRNFIENLVKDKSFSDTKIPLKILATDLKSGKEIIINKGKLVDAIMASISIPGVFPPVKLKKMLLVDGGLINPTPTNIIKRMGADIVIGVDLTMKNEVELKNPNIFQTLMRSYEILRTQSTKFNINENDKNLLIIKPNVMRFTTFKFYEFQKFIEEGERVAKDALPRIKSLLKREKRKHKFRFSIKKFGK
jgi:NTE family protein